MISKSAKCLKLVARGKKKHALLKTNFRCNKFSFMEVKLHRVNKTAIKMM